MTDPFKVRSLETNSADYAPGLLVHTLDPAHTYALRPGCVILIDDEAIADEEDLWRWFRESKGVTARFATDAEGFGKVARAEFEGKLL